MKESKGTHKFKVRFKAMTLFEVLKERGTINLTEAHRRMYTNQTEASHHGSSFRDMATPEVMDALARMLRADDASVEKLKANDIVKDILTDINRLNVLLENDELDAEGITKVINAKNIKHKLLGSYLGMWQMDKTPDKPETNPDDLFRGVTEGKEQ